MYDQRKQHQLENKSHVRGKLNKQFFSSQQEELERKRKQMKMILDQQVEERRKQKERQKYQQQRKIHQQEEKIKAYYAQIQQRQRKISGSGNNSGTYAQPANSAGSAYYNQSVKNSGSRVYESRANAQQYNSFGNNAQNKEVFQIIQRNRSKSRVQNQYDSGDIPVMPVMQSPDKQKMQPSYSSGHNLPHQNHGENYNHRSSAGNIPLLQLTQQEVKKDKKKSKRNPTKRDQKQKYVEKQKQKYIEKLQRQKPRQKQRRPTLADEEQPNQRQQTQFKQVFDDLNQQLQQQNKQLKKKIKKNEQAISLLMGAVKSNVKLDKFRIQAQKILHGQNSLDAKIIPITQAQSRIKKPSTRDGRHKFEAQKQKQSMLPKLKLRHQSIMHDYMFGSARRAHVLKSKTFK